MKSSCPLDDHDLVSDPRPGWEGHAGSWSWTWSTVGCSRPRSVAGERGGKNRFFREFRGGRWV